MRGVAELPSRARDRVEVADTRLLERLTEPGLVRRASPNLRQAAGGNDEVEAGVGGSLESDPCGGRCAVRLGFDRRLLRCAPSSTRRREPRGVSKRVGEQLGTSNRLDSAGGDPRFIGTTLGPWVRVLVEAPVGMGASATALRATLHLCSPVGHERTFTCVSCTRLKCSARATGST